MLAAPQPHCHGPLSRNRQGRSGALLGYPCVCEGLRFGPPFVRSCSFFVRVPCRSCSFLLFLTCPWVSTIVNAVLFFLLSMFFLVRVALHRRDGMSHVCCVDVVSSCLLLCLVHHRDYQPTVPDALVSYYLSRSGFVTSDTRVIRLIGLAAQKFIADVGNDALAQARLRMAAEGATGRGGKAARGGGAATGLGVDTRMTLTYVGGGGRRQRRGLFGALFCACLWGLWCRCFFFLLPCVCPVLGLTCWSRSCVFCVCIAFFLVPIVPPRCTRALRWRIPQNG